MMTVDRQTIGTISQIIMAFGVLGWAIVQIAARRKREQKESER